MLHLLCRCFLLSGCRLSNQGWWCWPCHREAPLCAECYGEECCRQSELLWENEKSPVTNILTYTSKLALAITNHRLIFHIVYCLSLVFSLTRQTESRLVQVADWLVWLFGRWGLGRRGRSHGFRCDWHLTDWTVVQSSWYTPQLCQLWFKNESQTVSKSERTWRQKLSPSRPGTETGKREQSATRGQPQPKCMYLNKRQYEDEEGGTLPCCELLSSCRRGLGKVFGPRSVLIPQWRGEFPPPGPSYPDWSPLEGHHGSLCLQRCCTPPSADHNTKFVVSDQT